MNLCRSPLTETNNTKFDVIYFYCLLKHLRYDTVIYETIFLHKIEQLQKDKYIAIKPAIIHHSSDTSNFCKENLE